MGAKLRSAAWLLTLVVGVSGCVSTDTSNAPLDRNKAVTDQMNLAKFHIQNGSAEQAVTPLNRALALNPRSAEVYGLLGIVYQAQGENALAEDSFKTALSYNVKASDVRNNYGAYLFGQNRLSEAYRQFQLASEDLSYPLRSRTFENMGLVALRQGNSALAASHFDKALRLNSSLATANLELADLYFKQGDNLRGWQYYQQFTGLARQNARSLWLGIQLARQNGEKDKVASYALQLQRLFPGSQELKEYRSRVGYE